MANVGNFGTLSSLDTLKSSQQSIAQYGEDRAFEAISNALAAHNELTRDMAGNFAEYTVDLLKRYGTAGGTVMEELDQFGAASPQKTPAGATVGFPLRKYGRALQWGRTYFETVAANEFAAQITDMMDADAKNFQVQMKRALYTPTNKTFIDSLGNNVALPLKALINADGSGMPVGPNGETFDGSTHTHYLYTAGTALAAADIDALVTTVLEHTAEGKIQVILNQAQAASLYGMVAVGQFVPLTPTTPAVIPAYTSINVEGDFNLMNPNNRIVGYWGRNWAEIWVKPWAQPGYVTCLANGGTEKPLAIRTSTNMMDLGNLRLMSEDENHPLRARSYERNFGVSVWNRVACAVSYIDTGGAGAYVVPNIAIF